MIFLRRGSKSSVKPSTSQFRRRGAYIQQKEGLSETGQPLFLLNGFAAATARAGFYGSEKPAVKTGNFCLFLGVEKLFCRVRFYDCVKVAAVSAVGSLKNSQRHYGKVIFVQTGEYFKVSCKAF